MCSAYELYCSIREEAEGDAKNVHANTSERDRSGDRSDTRHKDFPNHRQKDSSNEDLSDKDLAEMFKKSFARKGARVHYLGLWWVVFSPEPTRYGLMIPFSGTPFLPLAPFEIATFQEQNQLTNMYATFDTLSHWMNDASNSHPNTSF